MAAVTTRVQTGSSMVGQRCCARPCLVSHRSLISAGPRPVVQAARQRKPVVVARAEGRSGDSFMSGFILGGLVFGTLGFLFAPQISKALLGDDQRLRLPRFMEDEMKDPEATKQELIDKIAALNASIDEVAAKLEKNGEQVEVTA